MESPESNQVVVYRRISYEKDGRGGLGGLGIEAQKFEIDTVIQREGLKVIAEYVHVASASRKRGRNPENEVELTRAVAHAKRCNATLMVQKVDRASRNTEVFCRLILNSGVKFRALNAPQSFGTDGRIFLQMLSIFSEWEASEISKRTRAGIARLKARGEYVNPRRYDITPEQNARGRANAAIVRRQKAKTEYADLIDQIADLRLQGMTLNGIAKTLNDQNHRTRTGRLFGGKTILNILRYFDKQDIGFGVTKYHRNKNKSA